MNTFGKIIICIIVISIAVGIGYSINKTNREEIAKNVSTTNKNQDINNQNSTNNTIKDVENKDYIGKEENKDEIIPNNNEEQNVTEPEKEEQQEEIQEELIGKEKAIDIVKRKYALNGEIVLFHHMEDENYVIRMKDGTANTWYLVNGKTWEAKEY